MTLALHIAAKDLRRAAIPLAIWVLLMAAKLVFYAYIAGLFGHADLEWLDKMWAGPELPLRLVVEPLIAYVLVGWLVYEDPLVGTDSFWITRPISGSRLLTAKIVGFFAMFVVLPILVNVPWWLACGFGFGQIAASSIPMAVEYSLVVVVGMACAAATDGFPRYILWTIAGIACVLAVHLLVCLSLGAGIGVDTFQDFALGQAITTLVLLAACLVAISIEIILHQFLKRHFRLYLLFLAAGTAVGSALICSSAPNFVRNLRTAPHGGARPRKGPVMRAFRSSWPGLRSLKVKIAAELGCRWRSTALPETRPRGFRSSASGP